MYKIAVNTMALDGKLPAGDARWATFNDSFVNQELELIELANVIYTGHSYSGWHNGRRKLENFVCAQHIAVDMDTEDRRSTIETLSANTFVRTYAALIHTTASHTPDAPRARVLFLLDTPITDPNAYQVAAKFLISQFPGADPACSDASRFFFGAKNCEIWMRENVLPLAHLRRFYRVAQPLRTEKPTPTFSPSRTEPNKIAKPESLLAAAISKASEGQRNALGYWLACRFAEINLPQTQAQEYLLSYQRQVENGRTRYTEKEALKSLNSAYRRLH
jgi:hypothetical protein